MNPVEQVFPPPDELNPNPYQKGAGHVLATGHDAATCTACAYAAGWRDCERQWGVK